MLDTLLILLILLPLFIGLVDVGTGTAITFQSGLMAQVRSITHDGWERPSFETSHMGTTSYHTFMGGDLKDPGELTVEMLLDVNANFKTGIAAVAEAVTMTFPVQSGHSTPATFAASGFLTRVNKTIPYNDLMMVTATIKLTGDVTEVDGAA